MKRDEARRKRTAKSRDRQTPPRPQGTVVTLVMGEKEWSGSMIVPSHGEQAQKRYEANAPGCFRCVELLNEKWMVNLPPANQT